MDKSTLSNYGWVVCVILVLAIMISLATPFSTAIKNGVAKTVEDFKSDAENVLDNMSGATSFDDLGGGGSGGAGGGGGTGGSGGEENTDSGKLATVTGAYVSVNDVAPEEHELEVSLSSDTITDFSGVNVTKYGANLLDIEGREIVSFGANANTTQRSFTGNGIIVGFTYNNYYKNSNVTSFEKLENGFSFSNKENQMSYGIGFDFKVNPGTTYAVHCEDENGVCTPKVFVSEYDKDGNYLTYQFTTAQNNARVFTTGENTAWVVISVQNTVAETVVEYHNVFVGVDEFTEFEEYKSNQTVSANSDGTVTGLTSVSPNMTLFTDNSDVVITCKYQKKVEEESNGNISGPTISVENVTVKPGDTVDVSIFTHNNPGIIGMTLALDYDESVMTLSSITRGTALSEMTFTTPKDLSSGCQLPWDAEEVLPGEATNGEALILTFNINANAVDGNYKIALKYENGAIIDNDMSPVTMTIIDGVVNVKK